MDGTYLSPAIAPTQSLKNSKATLLRYPGGEKSDNYLFSAAPYTSSSPRMALLDTCFWPSNDFKFVDTNTAERLCHPEVLDFDEYIAMCNDVGAAPLVVVAYDAAYNTRSCDGKPTKAQLLTNAVEWVRYANIKKRYGVKYWMIGNESWNSPEYNGRVTPAKYADDLKDFATAMKAVDPSIKIIANGRSGWWQTILESAAVSTIDFLGLSEYPVFNYTGGYDYYRQNDVNLTNEVDLAIKDINTYAAAHQSRIKVIATEYNSIDWNGAWPSANNFGHALVNFQLFGDLIVKPKLEAACMWNTRWVENSRKPQSLYDAFDSEGNQNAIGLVIDSWGSSLLSDMVETTTSGHLVKSYASYDEADKKLNILLLNKDYTAQRANISISNYLDDFKGSVWQMRGASVNDKFPVFARTDSIFDPEDIASFSLPAHAVTIFKLEPDAVAFPIILKKFEAQKNAEGIELNWETLNEKNIAEYIIEKSTDGQNFAAIGTIAAANKDSSVYHYVDATIANSTVLYYRLIVVETNGNKESSKVISITVKVVVKMIGAHPNPFEDNVLIRVKSDTGKKISVSLIDVMGRILLRQERLLYEGNNQLEINNLSRLSKGIYLIKMDDETSVTTFKVIKK